MKSALTLGILLLSSMLCIAQEGKPEVTSMVRFNIVNPAIEIEQKINASSVLAAGLGVGYGGGYPDLTKGGSGFIYIISPFLDVQYKWFTNFDKRQKKGKIVEGNSANFLSMRLLVRGESLAENVTRTTNTDFAIGPTWGIQRKFAGNFNFLSDMGPIVYFDTEGTSNFFPLVLQLNVGYTIR